MEREKESHIHLFFQVIICCIIYVYAMINNGVTINVGEKETILGSFSKSKQ